MEIFESPQFNSYIQFFYKNVFLKIISLIVKSFKGLVSMDNVEDDDEYFIQIPRFKPLSGGMEILPGMRSGKLYFKPIIYLEKWDQYKGLSQMDIVNDFFRYIAKRGTSDPRRLYNIVDSLSDTMDRDIFCCETNQVYVDDYYDIILYMIRARTLELGVWEANSVTFSFISKYKSILEPRVSCTRV